MSLTPRAEVFLKALIERYIADGQPVGSRTLARQTGLDLSPATVRNIMADLEELGLIRAPHTSAGRIPTQLGYRLFVDTLVKVRAPGASELRKIEGDVAAAVSQDPVHLVESVSQLLSQATKLAGVVRVPKRDQLTFRHLEFLTLTPRRILVILVTNDGRVHNRVITTDKTYTAAELVQAANYFNDTHAGKPLANVKQALLNELRRDSENMQAMVRAAVEMAQQVFNDGQAETEELVVRGESNLLGVPGLNEVGTLRKLFDAFNTKRDLLHLLDESVRANGVQIFIGSESGYEALEECSLVAASYQVDGQILGTLAVVGPTRMAYEHIIPIVDITARLLSGALSGDRIEPPAA